jgi:hypothetical protein
MTKNPNQIIRDMMSNNKELHPARKELLDSMIRIDKQDLGHISNSTKKQLKKYEYRLDEE